PRRPSADGAGGGFRRVASSRRRSLAPRGIRASHAQRRPCNARMARMRRLLAALAAAWTAHGPPGPAAGQARDTAVYDLVQLAPGVYVSDVRPRPPASAFANSLVV